MINYKYKFILNHLYINGLLGGSLYDRVQLFKIWHSKLTTVTAPLQPPLYFNGHTQEVSRKRRSEKMTRGSYVTSEGTSLAFMDDWGDWPVFSVCDGCPGLHRLN